MDIDIFAPVPCPEPYSLDLVTIASRFSTHGLTRTPTTSANRIPTGTQPSPQLGGHIKPTATANIAPNKGADTRFNCTLCKKSFGTEATWTSHQKSAKHQAAVKDAEKKAKAASKKAGGEEQSKGGTRPAGPVATKNSASESSSGQPDNPALAEALQSLHKAEKAAKTHPALVAPVLWKTVKVLWTHRQYTDTKDALLLLISVLEDLQKNNASGTPPQQGNLTRTQINLTLFLARLAAARLVVYEAPQDACRYYVDAVQGRWQMPVDTFQKYSEAIGLAPVDHLVSQVQEFLEQHDKTQNLVRPTKPAAETATAAVATPPKKQPDPNLKLLTVLTEMGSLLAQSSSPAARHGLSNAKGSQQRRGEGNCLTQDEQSQAEFALTALAMASVIARYDPDQDDAAVPLAPTLARRRAAIYERLGMPHYASQCYSEAASMSGCSPHSRAWDEFQALLLAMEADDPIRVSHCLTRLSATLTDTYLDAHVLVMTAKAIQSADDDVLENDVRAHVDHLRLLAQTNVTDQLLMVKHCQPLECLGIVDRIQSLVSS